MHGGAPGSGAPKGNRNGSFVDGAFTAEALAERRWANSLARELTGSASAQPVAAKVRQLDGTARRVIEAPDGNQQVWLQQLQNALGSRSQAFVEASLQRLLSACRLPDQAAPSTTSVSAALALIQSLEPENEIQAALAVDAACLHAASTNTMSRLPLNGERRILAFANATARLERAFHSAVETFYKLKTGNRQTIRVERVIIQSDSQTIIGPVER